MQYAAALVQQGELKITDISARAGYCSDAAFSRRFTRYFGISPGSMRRAAQANGTAGTESSPLHALLTLGAPSG